MRKQDDLGAGVGQLGDRGRGALDAGCVGDDAVLDRHVEVDAQQDALARNIDAVERPERSHGRLEAFGVYNSLPIATAVSAMRLEKPHSLSYQESTRTSVPFCTLVWSKAKVDECGSWLKSIETFGWMVVPSTPFSGPAAAFLMASLISSLVVAFLATILRSTTETFGVGTRIETPSSLPASSGITRPIALAAPVEVGIIEVAAARPR